MRRVLIPFLLVGCSNEVTITEQENVAPEAVIQFPADLSTFSEVDTIELRGRVVDENGLSDLQSVQWSSSLDGPLGDLAIDSLAADGTTVQPTLLSVGLHVVTLEVVDREGLLDSDSITLTVEAAEQLPSAEILDPPNLSEVDLGTEVSITGSVADPNQSPDSLTVNWTVAPASDLSNTSPLVGTGPTQAGVTLTDWTPSAVGNYVVRLDVTDDDANLASAEIALLVADPGAIDGDGDGYSPNQGDCDDTTSDVSPVGVESCDGLDNDCNGIVDDKDLDSDNHIDQACTEYTGSIPADDCDDALDTVYTGAPEQEDQADNNCDGNVDEGTPSWDEDGDCACPSTTLACTGSTNAACVTLVGGDCDDAEVLALPGGTELTCDGIDNDCDALTPDAPDLDEDGVSTCDDDCDDTDPDNFPGNVESCDSRDNDCDQLVDNDVQNRDFWPDVDGDGYGDPSGTPVNDCAAPTGYVADNTDCDDNAATGASINPGAAETTCDGLDNDCDALTEDTPDGDEDGVDVCADCDDGDPNNFPGNGEACDGFDNDCDEAADNGLTFLDYWPDEDGDGEGDAEATPVNACEPPIGVVTVTNGDDCDDADPNNFTANDEVCDGLDNDCDEVADNDLLFEDWYPDSDGDGYGDGNFTPINACANPSTGPTDRWANNGDDCNDASNQANPGIIVETTCDGLDNDCDALTEDAPDDDNDGVSICDDDCDDGDPDNYPGNVESCDSVDNDCDNITDEDVTNQDFWPDADGDGFGDPAGAVVNDCAAPVDYVANNTDCDDTPGSGATINPGQAETTCDGLDNDCDALTVDAPDEDEDGVSTCDDDCDDSDPDNYPGNAEECDGADNDCDEVADNDLLFEDWYPDDDGDGFGDGSSTPINACANPSTGPTDRWANNGDDCNDTSNLANPGITVETTCDGLDNDCDALTVDAPDVDEDGVSICQNDCDDGDPDNYPGNDEVCDGKDNDCDEVADNGLTFVDYWPDSDEDGEGDDLASPTNACAAPATGTWATNNDDCDDTDPNNFTANEEICDEADNNCDELIDNGVQTRDYWPDVDGDGFGAGAALPFCAPPVGYVDNDLDCDDDPDACGADCYPENADLDICDGQDQDCDGTEGEDPDITWYPDLDEDGYTDNAASRAQCESPGVGWTTTPSAETDCDDDPLGCGFKCNPGVELDNCQIDVAEDNDCDGLVDENPDVTWYADLDLDGVTDNSRTEVVCEDPDGSSGLDQWKDFSSVTTDCDDTDSNNFPGNAEECDGLDNDCVNGPDNGLTFVDYWPDGDGDSAGDDSVGATRACEVPPNGVWVTNNRDCDDEDPQTYLDAPEICNDKDNDCDGVPDDGLPVSNWYPDGDRDGYGATGIAPVVDCGSPSTGPSDEWVTNNEDCNDESALANPGLTEATCDGLDNDCDLATPDTPDLDDDGVSICDGDCDDNDPDNYPGNVEACDNADNNCDELIDNGVQTRDYWPDDDGDGYGNALGAKINACSAPLGYVSNDTDCDDDEGACGALCNPGNDVDRCDLNGYDNDCDERVDENPSEDWYLDEDGDGATLGTAVLACEQPGTNYRPDVSPELDCDDDPNACGSACAPNLGEICDGLDNDCSGVPDDGLTFENYYADNDSDGYGAGDPINACAPVSGRVTNNKDCDDDPAACGAACNPGLTVDGCEAENYDNDCDSLINEDPDITWFADLDEDGFTDSGNTQLSCVDPDGATGEERWVVSASVREDCDDEDPKRSPGLSEVCDQVDNDCDVTIDEDPPEDWYLDADEDGVSVDTVQFSCTSPGRTWLPDLSTPVDCDDDNDRVAPGLTEVCDGIDNNCDTLLLADEDTDDDIDGYPLCNDCNDLDGQINPGVAERCDGIDNNCSGVRDDGVDTCPCPVRHFDSDGDDDLNSYLVCAIKDGSNNPLRLNWSQADEFCKRGTPDDPVSGYRLASINSQAENQAVYSWVGTIIAGQSIPFWLGGTDFESEGSWRWVNGDAWIYTNWATGGGFGDEPNNFNGVEHCLEMGNTGDDRWNDVDGGNTQFWVCEVQP